MPVVRRSDYYRIDVRCSDQLFIGAITLRLIAIDRSRFDSHFSKRVEDIADTADLHVEILLCEEIFKPSVIRILLGCTQHAFLPFLIGKSQCAHELLTANAVPDNSYPTRVAGHRTRRWRRHSIDVQFRQDRFPYFLLRGITGGGGCKKAAHYWYADESF